MGNNMVSLLWQLKLNPLKKNPVSSQYAQSFDCRSVGGSKVMTGRSDGA